MSDCKSGRIAGGYGVEAGFYCDLPLNSNANPVNRGKYSLFAGVNRQEKRERDKLEERLSTAKEKGGTKMLSATILNTAC
ncbi:hypothetical protein C9I99_19410 [Photobacterium lutimaris]|uniref:Uncharacterized protein n=1 Tax=Photobacterium lutimaris TaxID=388278 RepID=A0A2T3IUD0_9GAMM|nr:hypothetical protein C9I99_19410 [Photobacterium lutimaris]